MRSVPCRRKSRRRRPRAPRNWPCLALLLAFVCAFPAWCRVKDGPPRDAPSKLRDKWRVSCASTWHDGRCAFYTLAFDFAKHIQPNLTTAQSAAVYDALKLQSCAAAPPRPRAPGSAVHRAAAAPRHDGGGRRAAAAASSMVFVDAEKGADSNSGTIGAPLKTIAAAQAVARKASAAGPASIQLRAGTFYLGDTLALEAADSGLTIEAYQGETVAVSGAQPGSQRGRGVSVPRSASNGLTGCLSQGYPP